MEIEAVAATTANLHGLPGIEDLAQVTLRSPTGAATELAGLDRNPDVAFVDAVLADRAAYPDFSVALHAHRLCQAAYDSAADGGVPVPVTSGTNRTPPRSS